MDSYSVLKSVSEALSILGWKAEDHKNPSRMGATWLTQPISP